MKNEKIYDVIDESYDQKFGSTEFCGDTYLLIEEPFMDNNRFGEAAYFARAIKVGDKFDDGDRVKCYKVEWKIVDPETDDGAQACDWDEAENVEFETYVYYEHGYFRF